jgi:hypothetical protein
MTSTPASILDKLGQEDFERFLKLIYDTWNGNKDFLTQKFLKGMCNFYQNYKEDIDDMLFVKRLSILTKNDLDLALTRNIGNDKSIVIANCIFNKYNRNKKMYANNILNPKSYFYMFKN